MAHEYLRVHGYAYCAVLIQGLQQVILPPRLRTALLRRLHRLHAAHARAAVYYEFTHLVHFGLTRHFPGLLAA